MGGIASPSHDASIPMRVNLRPSSGETWAPIPDGYIVEWSWGNQRFIGNSVEIPFDQVPVEVTVKVTCQFWTLVMYQKPCYYPVKHLNKVPNLFNALYPYLHS